MNTNKRFLIIGTGFAGAVIAEQLSSKQSNKITVIEERNHIGGNCYSKRDAETNIMVHEYGPHIFHTNNIDIWNYINQFTTMRPFVNRVKTVYQEQVYSLPINLHTINQFFGKSFRPKEAELFIQNISDQSIDCPANFEEQAIKMLGKELYNAFFKGYTTKQWGCEPTMLPSSILKRLPVRFNYDDNYYSDIFQGIPKDGYTAIFENMLDKPNIEIKLNTKFESSEDISKYDHVFYTGPIDTFFNYKYGRLSYRTVCFEKNIEEGDFQGNAVINYSDQKVPYTRIHEHKHFTPWEKHEKTIYLKEFSKETSETDIPFYPKGLPEDLEKFEIYQEEVKKLKKYTFLGRLATYRYLDMHHVIEEALSISKNFK